MVPLSETLVATAFQAELLNVLNYVFRILRWLQNRHRARPDRVGRVAGSFGNTQSDRRSMLL
jgi:hypothetical protein